ncbi:YidC/Oxa1 family membrane protein insertase [Herbinix luporum]|uniref:YidC/Oxa1 family membrane protein insertase n=1 Tax=Herbinix luporum TaxID=1679721 RepID=UPI0023F01383|nr:YidC/Oxa1 family membrane protein insertase [Herbinix luporum]
MEVIFLFGKIVNPIASLLGLIMNAIYNFFNLFGIENIGLSIIVFTFITKTLMLPLTIKQQKFSRLQAIITPEIQKIQEKYKGKKDEASMRKLQAETQAVYARYGTNQTAGCLPMLITLPIMFALYRVINNIPEYVSAIRDYYTIVGTAIETRGIEVLSDIALNYEKLDLSNLNNIIKSLAAFNTSQWKLLLDAGLSLDADNAIRSIMNANNLFGLSITNTPSWKSISIIIPLLSMGLQFVQSKQLNVKTNSKDNVPNPMSSMNVVMPIMSGFFCLMLPIGVGLYWIANSTISIIQQFFVNKYLDSMDLDELVEKSQEKASKKYMKAKPAGEPSIQELAKKQTKSIESVSDKTMDNQNGTMDIDQDAENGESSYNPASISEIANILKHRKVEKGDK